MASIFLCFLSLNLYAEEAQEDEVEVEKSAVKALDQSKGAGLQIGEQYKAKVNYKELKEVKLICRDPNKDKKISEDIPCDELKDAVIKLARKQVAFDVENLYLNRKVDVILGTTTFKPEDGPTCNISAGEHDQNWLNKINKPNSCGEFCKINVSVGVGAKVGAGGPCLRERAWAKGAVVQALNHFKEEVFGEFKSKAVKLTDYRGGSSTSPEPIRPCAPMGADLQGLEIDNERLLKNYVNYMGEDLAAQATCQTQAGSEVASQGACIVKDVGQGLVGLWVTFLGCEIHARVMKDIYYTGNSEALQREGISRIAGKCKKAACIMCSNSKRNAQVNACYQSELPKFLKEKFEMYRTTEPLEMPGTTKSKQMGQS